MDSLFLSLPPYVTLTHSMIYFSTATNNNTVALSILLLWSWSYACSCQTFWISMCMNGTNFILIEWKSKIEWWKTVLNFYLFFASILFSYSSHRMASHTVSVTVELAICIISMRGSILDTSPRVNIHYWLYGKLGKNHISKCKWLELKRMCTNGLNTIRNEFHLIEQQKHFYLILLAKVKMMLINK